MIFECDTWNIPDFLNQYFYEFVCCFLCFKWLKMEGRCQLIELILVFPDKTFKNRKKRIYRPYSQPVPPPSQKTDLFFSLKHFLDDSKSIFFSVKIFLWDLEKFSKKIFSEIFFFEIFCFGSLTKPNWWFTFLFWEPNQT